MIGSASGYPRWWRNRVCRVSIEEVAVCTSSPPACLLHLGFKCRQYARRAQLLISKGHRIYESMPSTIARPAFRHQAAPAGSARMAASCNLSASTASCVASGFADGFAPPCPAFRSPSVSCRSWNSRLVVINQPSERDGRLSSDYRNRSSVSGRPVPRGVCGLSVGADLCRVRTGACGRWIH